MKLPGEAGGNWSERQTKARTYGPPDSLLYTYIYIYIYHTANPATYFIFAENF